MRLLLFILIAFGFLTFFSSNVLAIYNPVARENNIFGIHILFPTEVENAAKLVNSSGGDWGYVVIPIQYKDRDLLVWQAFMNDCAKYHIIPIPRLATESYWDNTKVWRKPQDADVLDFANFLNSLVWPSKNRYVVLFNEVNRYDEWGGEPPSPETYADLVSYAESVFKKANPDFFLITAGLDNSAPNDGQKYIDNFAFLRRIASYNPDVFKNIDGIASHSYPNPNFTQAPTQNAYEGTSTYKYEENIVSEVAGGNKPVFITETGWNATKLSQSIISEYFKTSMQEIWGQDKNVVAVTPFILESQNGSFDKFSFSHDGNLTEYGLAYQDLLKKKGDPILSAPIPQEVEAAKVYPKEFRFTPENFAIRLESVILHVYVKAVLAMDK